MAALAHLTVHTWGEPLFDAAEMWAWIEHQVKLGARRPGSPADLANEDFLAEQLRTFGLESVRKEPIPITYWVAQAASLTVSAGAEHRTLDAFPIPYTAFTPPHGIDAPLVYADPSRLLQCGDWRGAIVVTEIGFPPLDAALLKRLSLGHFDPDDTLRDVHHPATWIRLGWHLYRHAARRGAAGFVGVVRDQPGGSCKMYAPYGFKEKDILDKPIPGFWVKRDDGPYLTKLAQSGGRASLNLRGIRRPGVTHNVVGEIPGQSDEVIVLSCHHDSPFASPVEDASGVAVVLALAKHFATRRDLRRRLVVLFSAGHFYGSIGTRTFIHTHASDIVPRTVLEVSIEHVAREAAEDRGGALSPTGRPEAAGIFVPFNTAVSKVVLDAVKAHDVDRVLVLPAEGPLGDYPPTDGGDWYAAGVPLINYVCNPVYLLTDDDGPQWVDRDRLANLPGAFAQIIREADRLPRRAMARVDLRRTLLLMKLVKHIARAKTTWFGLKPVY